MKKDGRGLLSATKERTVEPLGIVDTSLPQHLLLIIEP